MPNRLINEQSPYLLQHAHNPVDWYPWGEEAFTRAKAENKPVIVSIGYSACHWCHVMERESFEDADTAAFMNGHFICVKVDREEHPDVDAFFMDAVQAISGSGGWPLNAFATPDRIPFYGGTYFPPQPAYSRPSWRQIMQRMLEIWTSRNDEVQHQSAQMLAYLRQVSKAATGTVSGLSATDCHDIAEALLKMADKEWGGFGGAPKFPGTMAITFLLDHYRYFGNEEALQHALLSLDRMIAGGIYDHLGGGFARYSTDREWLAPHFEKMLYDNALLVTALSDALLTLRHSPERAKYLNEGYSPSAIQQRYEQVIRQTIGFVNRELLHDSGAFYSALDADSEGIEGKFYTWNWQEWLEATGGGNKLAEAFWDISEQGNWEHTNILHEALSLEAAATRSGVSADQAREQLNRIREQLFRHRSGRVRPLTDDKCLLSWNALMNRALTKAGIALEDASYIDQAEKHLRWMREAFLGADGTLLHVWKNGEARIIAKLDDYAYLLQAMIALSSATDKQEWVVEAAGLCEEALELFKDTDSVFLLLTAATQEDIPVRKADVYDGATPSANAVFAEVLISLGMAMERTDWYDRGGEMLKLLLQNAKRYSYSFGHWATLIQRQLQTPKTLVTTGVLAKEWHQELLRLVPPHVLVFTAEIAAKKLPLTAVKKSDGDSLIFVCTGSACLPPVSTPEDALRHL